MTVAAGSYIEGNAGAVRGADGRHADTPPSFILSGTPVTLGGLPGYYLTAHMSNGVPVYFTLSGNGSVLEGGAYRDGVWTPVLTVHLNASGNSYSIEFHAPIDAIAAAIPQIGVIGTDVGKLPTAYLTVDGITHANPKAGTLAVISARSENSAANVHNKGMGVNSQTLDNGDQSRTVMTKFRETLMNAVGQLRKPCPETS